MAFLKHIPVMYVMSTNSVAGAREAFAKLEDALKDLRGRKFYGTYHPKTRIYRACVALRDVDDPKYYGLEAWVIPGGRYAKLKFGPWKDRVDEIGPAVDQMAEEHDGRVDESRPTIEFYRSEKELILYLPIK
jgi:hypothetical protein